MQKTVNDSKRLAAVAPSSRRPPSWLGSRRSNGLPRGPRPRTWGDKWQRARREGLRFGSGSGVKLIRLKLRGGLGFVFKLKRSGGLGLVSGAPGVMRAGKVWLRLKGKVIVG